MNLSITPVDKAREDGGAEGKYRGVKLLIARANNTRFRGVFKRLSKPFSREIEKGTISESDSEEILCTSIAKTILLGWSDFYIDGEEIEYTEENAKELMIKDPDCRQYVTEFSGDLDNYLRDDLEESKGE